MANDTTPAAGCTLNITNHLLNQFHPSTSPSPTVSSLTGPKNDTSCPSSASSNQCLYTADRRPNFLNLYRSCRNHRLAQPTPPTKSNIIFAELPFGGIQRSDNTEGKKMVDASVSPPRTNCQLSVLWSRTTVATIREDIRRGTIDRSLSTTAD